MKPLVADAHLRSSVGGIRGLARAGHDVLALGPRRSAAGLWSRGLAGRAVAPGADADPAALWEAIGRLAERHGPLAVYPGQEGTIDALLATEPPPGVTVPYTGAVGLAALRDKRWLSEIAAAAGLDSPATIVETTTAEVRRMPAMVPCVVKPAGTSSALGGARAIASTEELLTLLEELPADEPLLVQEHAAGPLVGLALVVDRDGRQVARFQQVTARTWPARAGGSSLAVSVAVDESLAERGTRLLRDAGYAGMAQLQFMENRGAPVLIDVNPRFYGSLALALACGVNLPAAWHAVVSGAPPPPHDRYRLGITYRLLESEVLAALRGSPGVLLRRPPRPRAPATWSARDPLPALLLAADAVATRVARRLPRRGESG
jgi:predicted ATP-grasp superfamily ATP-dependent carboligase